MLGSVPGPAVRCSGLTCCPLARLPPAARLRAGSSGSSTASRRRCPTNSGSSPRPRRHSLAWSRRSGIWSRGSKGWFWVRRRTVSLASCAASLSRLCNLHSPALVGLGCSIHRHLGHACDSTRRNRRGGRFLCGGRVGFWFRLRLPRSTEERLESHTSRFEQSDLDFEAEEDDLEASR